MWVEKKLFSGKYSQGNRIWRFIQDVHEAFDYILNQHTKKSKRFQIATRVSFQIVAQIKFFLNFPNLTAATRFYKSDGNVHGGAGLLLRPLVLSKSSSRRVQWSQKLLRGSRHDLLSVRLKNSIRCLRLTWLSHSYREWTFCTKCFTAFAGNTVVLTDNS